MPLWYDTVRSNDPADFVSAAECIDPNGTDTESPDGDPLPPGTFASYLLRAENDCGECPTGPDPTGLPRAVISCP